MYIQIKRELEQLFKRSLQVVDSPVQMMSSMKLLSYYKKENSELKNYDKKLL